MLSFRTLSAVAVAVAVGLAAAGSAAASTCSLETVGMFYLSKERTRIDLKPGEGAALTCGSNDMRATFSGSEAMIFDCGTKANVAPAPASSCHDWMVMSTHKKTRTRLDLEDGQGAAIICQGTLTRDTEDTPSYAVYDCN